MWLYFPKTFLIEGIGFQTVGTKYGHEIFSDNDLRLLKEKFGKDNFINRTETENLAEKLNVQPSQVKQWFKHQRRKGTVHV